jgi:outer membrane protein insertion porin family
MGLSNLVKWLGFICVVCYFLFSCTVVKNYPVNKPFVYENNVQITGNINKDEKKKLTSDLSNYWDDSLRAQTIQQFGVRYVLKNPPVFDTANLSRTKVFMTGYLNSEGFYTPTFANLDSCYSFDTVVKKNKPPQIRTTINLKINPGKQTIVDSLSYNLSNELLDSLATVNRKNSFIKPGKTPFSKQTIASELDRLVTLYRKQGYFLLTRDNLVAEVDTSLVSPSLIILDPFQQARILAEATEKRKQNPTCIVVIKERPNPDSALAEGDSIFFKQYYIGNIYYYPETRRFDIPDTLMHDTASFKVFRENYYTMYYRKGLFKFQPMREHSYISKGSFYNEDNFYKTLNNLNAIGTWERIDYRTVLRNDSIDFHYFLTPAKRETVSLNLELSHSTGDFLSTSSLVGISFNVNYLNRNLLHRAIQSNTTLSNGVEFGFNSGTSFIQTLQSSLTQSFSIPRLVGFSKLMSKVDAARTNLVLNGSYYDRKDFYRLRSVVGSWGYQWRQKNVLWQFKFPNVELYFLDTLPGLDSAFQTNPYLRTSFNTGAILGAQGSFIYTYPSKRNKNITNYIRLGTEISSAFGIRSLEENVYQFIKLEAEYRKLINYSKSSLAFRGFGGIGYNYHFTEKYGKTLPFYKQFIAGGPNSMRAWGLRLLGLGSSLVSDTAKDFRDRYGDMQLEGNVEYRFTLAQFSGVKIGSALFVDMGNIWNIYRNDSVPNADFDLRRLWQDWAIGVGTGIRLDFSYFLIRVDFGIKVKDPAQYQVNNGWVIKDFTWRNYLYSVKNADGVYQPATRNNYAFQLGIGLPF